MFKSAHMTYTNLHITQPQNRHIRLAKIVFSNSMILMKPRGPRTSLGLSPSNHSRSREVPGTRMIAGTRESQQSVEFLCNSTNWRESRVPAITPIPVISRKLNRLPGFAQPASSRVITADVLRHIYIYICMMADILWQVF